MECSQRNAMGYDEACLRVINPNDTHLTVLRITTECHKCDLSVWHEIPPNDEEYLAVDTCFAYKIGFTNAESDIPKCNITYQFAQHGWYQWTADPKCPPVIETEAPDNPYIPITVLVLLGIILLTLMLILKIALKIKPNLLKLKRAPTRESVMSDATKSTATTATTHTTTQTTLESETFPVPQVLSVQVFRGIAILMFITVDGDISSYWFLTRTPWNGIMPADFVYPWILWGMGAAFYFEYRSAWLLGTNRRIIIWRVLRRSIRYMVAGVFLNSFENNYLPDLRIPGFLQRYGILHMFVFSLEVLLMKRDIPEVESLFKAFIRDFMDNWAPFFFTLACLAFNLLVTHLLPVPGCPKGYIGPGGLHEYSSHKLCAGGAAGYLDNMVFGPTHLDQDASVYLIYLNENFVDEHGILSTFNAVLLVYGGTQASKILVYYSRVRHHFFLFFVWGILQTVLALGLCEFKKEDGLIPLNSVLWSTSFVLLTSGTAFLFFAILYAIVDVCEMWSGTPFFETGLNTMLIYILSNFFIYSFPFSWTPVIHGTYSEFVLMGVLSVAFWIYLSKWTFHHII